MRGFPFFNLLICLLLSSAVLLPLVLRATHIAPAAAPAAPQVSAVEETISVLVAVKFVHAPVSLTLRAGDKVLAEWRNGSASLRWEQSLPMSKGTRLEFSLAVQWPENTPDTVAEVTVEPDGLTSQTQNLWSSGPAAEEVLTFTWQP